MGVRACALRSHPWRFAALLELENTVAQFGADRVT